MHQKNNAMKYYAVQILNRRCQWLNCIVEETKNKGTPHDFKILTGNNAKKKTSQNLKTAVQKFDETQ